jgi:hypothetical protein
VESVGKTLAKNKNCKTAKSRDFGTFTSAKKEVGAGDRHQRKSLLLFVSAVYLVPSDYLSSVLRRVHAKFERTRSTILKSVITLSVTRSLSFSPH